MTSRKKYLTELSVDADNCRIYVSDRDDHRYVLVDHGHTREKAGMSRFELCTHTDAGEPEIPLPGVYWEFPDAETHIPWILDKADFIKDALFKDGELVPITNREHALKVALEGVNAADLDEVDRLFLDQSPDEKASRLETIIKATEGNFAELPLPLMQIAEVFFDDLSSDEEPDLSLADEHYRVLTLSTAHLSLNDIQQLKEAASDIDEWKVIQQREPGFLVKLDEELSTCLRHGHSETIKGIIRHAYNTGCRMIDFDRDAPVSPRFPKYR